MQTECKVEAKVIGKWIKQTFFRNQIPYLSLEFRDATPKYYDMRVSMAFWNACDKGDELLVTMYMHSNGLWYPDKEILI